MKEIKEHASIIYLFYTIKIYQIYNIGIYRKIHARNMQDNSFKSFS